MTAALMYHDVVPAGAEDTSGFPGRDAALYKVTPEQFDEHLEAIRHLFPTGAGAPRAPQRRCRVGDAASSARPDADTSPRTSLSSARCGRRRSSSDLPTITFDDGGASALTAADALERHGFTGHFFITANYIGTRGFVTAQNLRELRGRGHVIGSHSCSHPLRMGHCSWPQVLDEWTRSRSMLSGILGEDVEVASVPGGDFAPQVAEAAARAGFARLFTSEPTLDARHAFGLTLLGRFTIQRWTTADSAAALAAGEWLACARQAVVWNAKKISKRLGGERYLQLRKLLLRHGDEVRWGDRAV
jgi:peptidoglycan/xylan/chitin deacetylase (PgdA/CDA1 family)